MISSKNVGCAILILSFICSAYATSRPIQEVFVDPQNDSITICRFGTKIIVSDNLVKEQLDKNKLVSHIAKQSPSFPLPLLPREEFQKFIDQDRFCLADAQVALKTDNMQPKLLATNDVTDCHALILWSNSRTVLAHIYRENIEYKEDIEKVFNDFEPDKTKVYLLTLWPSAVTKALLELISRLNFNLTHFDARFTFLAKAGFEGVLYVPFAAYGGLDFDSLKKDLKAQQELQTSRQRYFFAPRSFGVRTDTGDVFEIENSFFEDLGTKFIISIEQDDESTRDLPILLRRNFSKQPCRLKTIVLK